MQVTDDMVRAAFEQWALQSGEFTDLSKSAGGEIPLGQYLKPRVELAWQAWSASNKTAQTRQWLPVSEAEPNKTYLLGWHDWRDHAWCTEVAPAIHGQRFENGYSNVSRHGSATHYMPLPAPPLAGGE